MPIHSSVLSFFLPEATRFSEAARLFSKYDASCTVENNKTFIVLKNVSATFHEILEALSKDRTIDYYQTDKIVIWRINFSLLPEKLEAHCSRKRNRDDLEISAQCEDSVPPPQPPTP